MLEATTRIYVRDPEREDDLVPAVVSETLGEKVMVRFLQPVSFSPGIETVIFFHNLDKCFTSVPCQLQRMFSKGQYPTGALVLQGEAEVAENRNSLRIDTLGQHMTATVNGTDRGEVVNISCGGIALLLDAEGYEPEQWLEVTLHDACGDYAGRMRVRSRFKDSDGRCRYGLMADPSGADLISQLTRITQEVQNISAPGDSRSVENNKANTQAATAGPGRPAHDEKRKTEQGKEDTPAPRDGTERLHQRTPWPGMAKVYIREENNIRVRSVDTEDLSRGGISFTSPHHIYEGNEVLFEKPIIGGFFRVMIVIRNIHILTGGMYRVGAQFRGAPLQPGVMPKGFEGHCEAA